MKICLVAFLFPLLFTASLTFVSAQTDVVIDWSIQDNLEKSVGVGDTVEFTWTNGSKSVYLHPGGSCDSSQAVQIGDSDPPVSYTFTQNDANTQLIFASAQECNLGETVTFNIGSTGDSTNGDGDSENDNTDPGNTEPGNDEGTVPPSNCRELQDELAVCLEEAGALAPGQIACETCLSTAIASGISGRGVDACITSEETACGALVGCPCQDCEREAVAYGTCEIDEGWGEDCPPTDCSDELDAGAVTAREMAWPTALGFAMFGIFV